MSGQKYNPETTPKNLEDLISTAFSLRMGGFYKESYDYVIKNMGSYVGDYRIYELLSDNCLMLGNYAKTLEYSNIALDINPESVSGNYLKAAALMSTEKFKEAIPFWEKVMAAEKNNPEILEKLGLCKFFSAINDEEVDRAMILLKRAYAISGGDPLIAETIGVSLATEGRFKEAREYLEKSNLTNERKEILKALNKLASGEEI